MIRAVRFVLAAAALSASFCGTAAADIRQQGPDVRTERHDGIVANIYPDKSFWLILPYRSQSLYLDATGSAVLFDGAGQTLGTGKWDAAEGTVAKIGDLPDEMLSKVKGMLAHIKKLPAKPAAPTAPPTGSLSKSTERAASEIDWVDEKN